MSLRRMMRNARRAVNYNLAAQLPQDIYAKSGPTDIYLDGGPPKIRLSEVRPEDFDIDMMVRTIAEDGNGD